MLDPATTERIRSIFLHHEPFVSIDVAARMLGLSKDEIRAAIEAGDIETIATRSGPVIDRSELAEQALHIWPIATIEQALRREAALVLPPGVRTRRFTARLPRYIIAALDRLGGGERGDGRKLPHARSARPRVRAKGTSRIGDRRFRRGDRLAAR